MMILHPELGEDQVKKEIKEIHDFAKETGGEVYFEDLWGLKDLCYMIKKQDKGIYVVLNLTADPSRIKELEKHFSITPMVLRYLMLKIDEHYKAKTLVEYEALAAEEDKIMKEKKDAEEKKEEDRRSKKPAERMAKPKKEEKEEEEEVKPEKKVKEEKKPKKEKPVKTEEEEKAEAEEKEKKMKKSSKATLEEVDQKLKNLIDDPDIKL